MNIQSIEEAIRLLEDMTVGSKVHLEAIRYLSSMDECYEVEGLVRALESDDFGVRWEAAKLLASLGKTAVVAMLRALLDPKRVADPRLREGILHAFHILEDHAMQSQAAPLLKALKGPAPEVDSMKQAYLLLKQIDPTGCPQIQDLE